MSDDERSPSGQPIYRYAEPPSGEPQLAGPGDEAAHEAIDAHIAAHIGPVRSVYHELISPLVHVDVHVIAPTEARPCWVLVTSGMSDLPMKVPEAAADKRYAELMVCLPKDWPIPADGAAVGVGEAEDPSYWPVRCLKFLARFPHEYGTWLGWGHSIPNGNPAAPYAPDAPFTGVLIVPSVTVPSEFWTLEVSPEKTIHFYALWFVTSDEMKVKLKEGTEGLLERFKAAGITDRLDLTRASLPPPPRKWWWPFG